MKPFRIFVLLCCSFPAFALHGGVQKATVYAMRKVPCEVQGQGNSGFLVGGRANDCTEYELRTAKVDYIIRPRHDILLLLGSDVSIRLANSELLLRTTDSAKDIRCQVLAMTLRSEVERRERNRERDSRPICYSEAGREILCPEEVEPVH